MKLLFILHSTIMGGATISCLKLVHGLIDNNIVPIIVYPNRNVDKCFLDIVNKYGIKTYSVPIYSSVYMQTRTLKGLFVNLFKCVFLLIVKKYSISKIEKIVMCENPDIIHTNTGVIHEGLKVAKRLKIPHVWHLREYQDKDFNWEAFPCFSAYCQMLRKSYVITITNDIKAHFGLLDFPYSRTIYNGVFKASEANFIYPKEKYFLCASRVSPEKGHLDIIWAFALFLRKHVDYKLLIAGFGNESYIAQCVDLAKKLGCEKNVLFSGYVEDVRPLMDNATALVVASYNEGFGRMSAEACFRGCLLIGRNTGGTKEIMDSVGGFPFLTTDDLLRQMFAVAALEKSEYQRIALFVQKKAVQLYSEEEYVENVLSFYKEILCE